jgi:hypothetical protein
MGASPFASSRWGSARPTRKANSVPVFVIFVEGADTEPARLPVYCVESEEHASLICEGLKESEYRIFDFSFNPCTRSDRGKFAVWAAMICDARDGVYGNIVGGIYKMIDGAYSVMSGRRTREKTASGCEADPTVADQQAENVDRPADQQAEKMLAGLGGDRKASQPPIPTQYRTRPLTKGEAARYLGLTGARPDTKVSRKMTNGKLPFEPIPTDNRRYIYDKRKFDQRTWLAISPR